MSSDSDTDEEYISQLEALLARIFHRGKEKFKNKLPIIFLNCNEVGHIAARCPKKRNYKGNDKYKSRRSKDNKEYKDKGKSATLLKKMIMMNWCMMQ